MAYTKHTWQRGDVITSAKLNEMEEGITNMSSLPYLEDVYDEELDYDVYGYYSTDSDAPIVDANEILQLLLHNQLRWAISDYSHKISQISALKYEYSQQQDPPEYNLTIECSDGSMYITNSDNRIIQVGRLQLVKVYSEEYSKDLLLLMSEFEGVEYTIQNTDDIYNYLATHEISKVYYRDDEVVHSIKLFDFSGEPTIVCDNGDTFIASFVQQHVSAYVKSPVPYPSDDMVLHTKNIDMGEYTAISLVLMSSDGQTEITADPLTIVETLLTRKIPWIIIGSNSADTIIQICNTDSSQLGQPFLKCNNGDYCIDNSTTGLFLFAASEDEK